MIQSSNKRMAAQVGGKEEGPNPKNLGDLANDLESPEELEHHSEAPGRQVLRRLPRGRARRGLWGGSGLEGRLVKRPRGSAVQGVSGPGPPTLTCLEVRPASRLVTA